MEPLTPEPAADTGSTLRQRLMTLLKIGVTVGGLYLVISQFDLGAIVGYIGQVSWGWMGVGLALMALSMVVRAYRWRLVLAGVGSSIRFGRLVELYLVGSFFNAFLPSGLGGDVVRAAEAAQDVDSGTAAGTVVIDRLTGLLALFAMALAVLPFRPPDFPPTLLAGITAICAVGLIGGLVVLDGRLFGIVVAWLPERLRQMGHGFLPRTAAVITLCGWRAIAQALLVSVVFNLMQVGWWATTGRALGLHIAYSYYLLVVPVMSLALLVPSIGGLGVRETLAPALFAGAGALPEQAVALSLLVFGLERFASLLGAPVYLWATVRDARARRGRPVGSGGPDGRSA